MKKVALFLGVLLVLFCFSFAVAGQETVTWLWQQNSADLPTLWGWKLWVGTTSGGPYDKGLTYFRDGNGNPVASVDIPYDGTPSPDYTGDTTIVVPDGAETTLCFVVNAWDVYGQYSGNSNEVCESFDFVPPNTPIQFKIKVKTRP